MESKVIFLTHSAAPRLAFEGGAKKRRSGSTPSKPGLSSRGVEGLTKYFVYSIQRIERFLKKDGYGDRVVEKSLR
jgi:hypothetical protein